MPWPNILPLYEDKYIPGFGQTSIDLTLLTWTDHLHTWPLAASCCCVYVMIQKRRRADAQDKGDHCLYAEFASTGYE